jgi:hypothetical protein
LGYDAIDDHEASSSTVSQSPDVGDQPMAPAATPEPIDCNKPIYLPIVADG